MRAFIYRLASIAIVFMVLPMANLQAQIVLNEIRSDGGTFFSVEIKNQGASTVNIGGYFLCHWPSYDPLISLNVDCGSLLLGAGDIVVVSNFSGGTAADGELGLYINGSFGNPASILDYVEWGSTGHMRSSVAQSAGIWSAGDFLPAFNPNESIEYTGTGDTSASWELEATLTSICSLNPPGDNCTLAPGTISTSDPTTTCTGDGLADEINVDITGQIGNNSTWLIVDSDSSILAVEDAPPFDFEGASPGVCLIFHVIYNGDLTGAQVGSDIRDLEGCHELSNSISITRLEIGGGSISTSDPTTICVGDGIGDSIDVALMDTIGDHAAWVITDTLMNILALPDHPPFQFDAAGPGVCLIWSMSYLDGLTGLTEGQNISNIVGCFHLSDSIRVNRLQPDGGEISTSDNTILCLSNPGTDTIHADLTNEIGSYSLWLVTDTSGNILSTSETAQFAFDVEAGICQIWHVSFEDILTGAEPGSNLADLSGCFDLSNAITVVRNEPDGGMITASDTTTYCLGNDLVDTLHFSLEGSSNAYQSMWLVQDENGLILELSSEPAFNFNAYGAGTYLVSHLNYVDGLAGLLLNSNVEDLMGCFDFSNLITIQLFQPVGGTISTVDETEFCFLDADSFMVEIELNGAIGANSVWLISDSSGEITGINLESLFIFDGEDRTCEIRHVSYYGILDVVPGGTNLDDLTGCFELSNAITIRKNRPDGGVLSTTDELFFCVGSESGDSVDVQLEVAVGEHQQWMIADAGGEILDLPDGPPFDFSSLEAGTYAIFHLSYATGLSGLVVGGTTAGLEGCWDVSNPIIVTGADPIGGAVTALSAANFCVGDGIDDLFDAEVTGAVGSNSTWLLVNESNTLITTNLPPYNFDDVGVSETFMVYHLSYEDDLIGLNAGSSITNLQGCFELSNGIAVTTTEVDGGEITTSDNVSICVDDTIPDPIDVQLVDTVGAHSQWVITDTLGNILDLPANPPFDLSGAGVGVCQIWHLSHEDGLTGLTVGQNVANLVGCHDFSNGITVDRNNTPTPASIMTTDSTTGMNFCDGDGIPDPIDVILIEGSAMNSLWLIMDGAGEILAIPAGFPFDLEGVGDGIRYILHIGYQGSIDGAEVGLNVVNLQGCFSISNLIDVGRKGVNGGSISTMDETNLCVGDGTADIVNVTLVDEEGENNSWIITDETGEILDLPTGPPFDFETAGLGICSIWHIGYEEFTTGIQTGLNINGITGCYDLSNSIEISRDTSGAVCEQVGLVPSLSELVSMDIFPNPSKGNMNLSVHFSELQEEITVQITNILGDVIQVLSYSAQRSLTESIDLHEVSAGQYFLKLSTNEGFLVQPFIKIE